MSQVEYDVDNKDKTDEEKEEQYVAVEGAPEGDAVDDQAGKDVEGEDDARGNKEESRLGGGREEESEDDKKSRRREENKTRRQRQKVARDRTDRELKFLRDRNEQLERRFSSLETEVDARVTGSEISTVDTSINKARSDMQLANQVIQQSIEQQDGKNLAEAMDHRDTIRDNLRDLEQAREYLSQEKVPSQQPPMQLDPRHVAHAQSFMVDHDWWDPRGGDAQSRSVLQIDRDLAKEGFNPVTKEYWDELRQRVQADLPQHADAGGDADDDDAGDGKDTGNGKDPKRRSRGPEFRTGGRERPLGKNEVYISPERKDAMIEAGVWEDPALRNKYLKAYATYDAQEQGSA